ncbi:hypothetical protein ES703_61442 [subsurface metagenome]
MLNKSELLQMSRVSQELFEYSVKTKLIPSPNKILWLDKTLGKGDYFPDYVLSDLFHINYLTSRGICSAWELRESILGEEGGAIYEDELKRRCGNRFYSEVHLDQSKVGRRLCHVAEESFRPQRVASLTFRTEKVGERTFLVLSRVLLRPKGGFFEVEIKEKQSEDSEERTAQAYRLAMKEWSHE